MVPRPRLPRVRALGSVSGAAILALIAAELLQLTAVLLFMHLGALLWFGFSLTHATRRLGAARAAPLLALVLGVSLLFEGMSVATG